MSDTPTLTERLAAHLLRPVPANVQTKARLHLLDWLACVVGARASESFSRSDMLISSDRAALLGNVLEMDDVHRSALLHPGPIVWAAIKRHAFEDMSRVLEAAVRGYEAMIAIGATLDSYHYAHWHPTATVGPFAAAAVTASYFELDERETTWALANAGSVAGGFWHMRHDDVETKQWHVLNAVRAGDAAGWAAMSGIRGPSAILEGPQGLYAAMTRAPKPMELKSEWRIDEVSFKPWGACRHVHPAIDAALELKRQGRLESPVRVETYADALTFCDRPNPRTVIEAKFSLQHGVAIVLDKGVPELADFEPNNIERLSPLRAQVSVAEAAEFTAAYPAHFGAEVNGLKLLDALGDPERPLSAQGVEDKARALFAWGGLSNDQAAAGVDLALHGDNAEALDIWLDQWL